MHYLVAVSGGIDSVALLDMLVNADEHELCVAHFDHGIRSDSAGDARFVKGLAAHYGLPFVACREELGVGASEETARDRRYAFLHREAEKRGAIIATAHHADDAVETVTINLTRGTGWRGLAVFDGRYIARPLLHMTKIEIRQYVTERRLEWVEDSTNNETVYLRNRMRRKIVMLLSSSSKQDILTLRDTQVALKTRIDELLQEYSHTDRIYERYFFIMIDRTVAIEVLRSVFIAAHSISPTRPQLERALSAIKAARAGSTCEVGDGVSLRFLTRTFLVETP
jgi:tRNA(Ile)-lysidine synthase